MYIFKNTLTHVNQHFLDGYFLQVLNLFMCRKYKIIFAVKNEEQSFTLQKSVGNFIAQQKVKKSQLCSKKCKNFMLQKNAEDVTPQQKVESIMWQKLEKSSFYGRNGEQAQFAASSLGLWTHFAHKLAMVELYLRAHFAERQAQLTSQKKPRLSVIQ